MNSIGLKNELALFFQTLPESGLDLDTNYISNFNNLLARYVSEIRGEGFLYPLVDSAKIVIVNEAIKEVFEVNMSGIASSIITPQEYSQKVGSAMDGFIDLLPQIFILNPGDKAEIAEFKLSTDLIQLLGPIFANPASTSLDLANGIVDGFLIKLKMSSIVNVNAGTTLNWITN